MTDDRDSQPNRIRVFLRVRPCNREESSWFRSGQYRPILRDEHLTPNADKTIVIERSGKRYDFDRVFRAEATQRQLFQYGALPTLENVFNGYCGAVLAYGQTGTGKTHTMQGYDRDMQGEQRGIIPRSAEYIFNRINRTLDLKFTVVISFVQIYLDKLQDLFKPEAPEVMINPETERVELPGITQIEVRSPEEMMKHFYWGERHRVTRATKMNETSSRGHAAFIVNIQMTPHNNDGSQATRHGKLVLVDLAGYERFTQTGITTGIAAEEAKKINASLLALGSVVNALAEACAKKGPPQAHHIPYRNAKLTRLLKDCLGGTSVTAIICTIGPCDKYNQETTGTLYFGWRAMAVKVDAKIKESFDPAKYAQILKAKLQAAHERIHSLVAWWSRSNPKDYAKYVQKYGEPEFLSGMIEDDYESQIMEALTRTQSSSTQPQSSPASLPLPADDDEDDSGDVPAAVRQVQRELKRELDHQVEYARREEEELRLRHLQDIEEAVAAGVSEETLANLKREHGEELQLMREQNKLLKQEIIRQKQKEEVQALLTSAKEANDVNVCRLQLADPVAEQRRQELHRINEIVEHLQQTCENKDEVLNRMFELICYYEAKINDYDINVVAIAAAHSGPIDADRSLAEARKREEELRTMLFLQNEEIEGLKKQAAVSSVGLTADSLDAQWSRAINVPATALPVEELQTKAFLLREQLQDVLRRIEESAVPSNTLWSSSTVSSLAPTLPTVPGSASTHPIQPRIPSTHATGPHSTISHAALSASPTAPPVTPVPKPLPGSPVQNINRTPVARSQPGPAVTTGAPIQRMPSPMPAENLSALSRPTAPQSVGHTGVNYAPISSSSSPVQKTYYRPSTDPASGTYSNGPSSSLTRTASYGSSALLQSATIPSTTTYTPGFGLTQEDLVRSNSLSRRTMR